MVRAVEGGLEATYFQQSHNAAITHMQPQIKQAAAHLGPVSLASSFLGAGGAWGRRKVAEFI